MSIEIERAEAITWIRIQMAQHGLSLADLQAAGCFAESPPPPTPGAVRYRNAHGQGWDGRGAMPDLLQRAVNAGQTVEHFRVLIAESRGAP
jgi:DNA-binding protein H-NS